MDKIALLAQARKTASEAAAHKKALLESFLQSEDYEQASDLASRTAATVGELESEIRAEYQQSFDGNKKPHPAIQMKEFDATEVIFSESSAKTWCLRNFTPALKLDKAVFEKAAKAGDVPAEIAQVKPAKEVRAQIALDLSAYL